MSLQGCKVLFPRRISSQPTACKNRFLRAVGVVFSTDRTHFWHRTQKLTRQIEVESHTSQTPSKMCVVGERGVRKQARKYIQSNSPWGAFF